MEPASNSIIKYVIHSTVCKVSEEEEIIGVKFEGNSAVYTKRKIGWFVQLEGSHEKIFLGPDKPDLTPGDRMEITIRKIGHAKLIEASV